MSKKAIAAGAFKQTCLAVLDQVAATGGEVVVTKRGRPVARVVPVGTDAEREAMVLARLRGRAKMLVNEARFLQPIGAAWDVLKR